MIYLCIVAVAVIVDKTVESNGAIRELVIYYFISIFNGIIRYTFKYRNSRESITPSRLSYYQRFWITSTRTASSLMSRIRSSPEPPEPFSFPSAISLSSSAR